jgi:hypothetical protein
MVRRSCLDTVGYFDETLEVTEDWHLWLRIAHDHKIGYIPQVLTKHRKHAANTGVRYMPGRDMAPAVMWSKIFALYPEVALNNPSLVSAKLVGHYLLGAARSFRHGSYKSGGRLLVRAFRANPLRMRPAHAVALLRSIVVGSLRPWGRRFLA